MSEQKHVPYVPVTTDMAELTVKAVALGVVMAIVLGAANAYVGMKAGLTVAAAFPAAVVAMAVLRPFNGTILEENIARTTASVGESLMAGAIFTIPAFVITGAWDTLRYWESTAIMFIGGVLGVLFVIVLRRTLVVEADLPFPESVAAAEIVKAGQGGQTGAKYVVAGLGLAAFWELFKNSNGILLIKEKTEAVVEFGRSSIEILGVPTEYPGGGLYLSSPAASPMLMGVGYIIGLRLSAVVFAGAVIGWLFLVPLAVFLNPALSEAAAADPGGLIALSEDVWFNQVRPLAVGTMIVAAFYTLYNLRGPLVSGIRKAFGDIGSAGDGETRDRTDVDLPFSRVIPAIGIMAIATFFLYWYFAQNIVGALILTVVMVILGFLFAAVAGYLVGLIGNSNNPISGLTLSALLIAAILMVAIGLTDVHGVAAVLAVAGVVCCAAGIAGDMMQDLKVGHILGGTPWRMEVGEIIGVIGASLVLAVALNVMHGAYTIGSAELPAPQAGLMALIANGIVGGEMAWPLVIVGMFFAVGLILVEAPAPMLIAVGMYLPFYSTAAIFAGGLIHWGFTRALDRRNATDGERTAATNKGILLSSGFIAGESLMAVLLAFLFMGSDFVPAIGRTLEALTPSGEPSFLLGLLIYPVVIWLLAWLPLKEVDGRD
ncbi:MAG: oligopeptide transporter, OPT family [marine benthic group bacterium]|jgi:putative OPT family oligopeptide transporter|nr:oligopeptide transporter, OPT family [Gemmatimonadota bacterium]MCL7936563.1 oligopeptide transporter, OPT family [Gemmatimonadota bacterium]MCL7975889.1 oligopeptide transporter, OPT family [Gemmatimonadota bacterium]